MKAERPFWRTTPLTNAEHELLSDLEQAHRESARRENVSTQMVQMAAIGSADYLKAIAGALMALGGLHGPIIQAMRLIKSDNPSARALDALLSRKRIPGWGNSFTCNQPDPIWATVERLLINKYPCLWKKVEGVTGTLHEAGKLIFPNPALYTALVAIVLEMPEDLAPFLFVSSRLEVWSEIYLEALRKTPRLMV